MVLIRKDCIRFFPKASIGGCLWIIWDFTPKANREFTSRTNKILVLQNSSIFQGVPSPWCYEKNKKLYNANMRKGHMALREVIDLLKSIAHKQFCHQLSRDLRLVQATLWKQEKKVRGLHLNCIRFNLITPSLEYVGKKGKEHQRDTGVLKGILKRKNT